MSVVSKPKKLTLLTFFGAGYVLGARAGRERYEQIVATASRVKGNPTVQAAASRAQETVAAQAPVVASAVKDTVKDAKDKVGDTFSKDEPSTVA
jgi:hypothetical protein